MYKAYYSFLENRYEEDNVSLSSSFWSDQEDSEECNVEDDRIKTGLGIYKQELNKEEELCVEDNSITEQTGEKTDLINESGALFNAKKQSTDENSACESEVNRHDYCNPETLGKERGNKKQQSGPEDQKSEDDIRKVCPVEKTSVGEHDMIENFHSEFRKAGKVEVKRREKEDNAENQKEVQSNYFNNDENVMSLDEESESSDLESDEEIEYFASVLRQGVIKDDESKGEKFERDEELGLIFGTQDDRSKPVLDDEHTCAGAEQMYQMEKYPESMISFMDEQHSDHFALVNADSTDEANQIYSEHRHNNGSAEQIWNRDSDPSETGVYDGDFYGSMSSLSASIITSGYGTYNPDSPKGDLNGRDDCSLFELELETKSPIDPYAQEDPDLSWYRRWLSPDVAQQLITSASLNSGDLNPFDSCDSAAYNHAETVPENRPGSSVGNPGDSGRYSISAEISELEEHLAYLHVSSPDEQHELYTESEETSSYSDRNSSATEELPSAFQIYIKGMTRSCSENDLRPRVKSCEYQQYFQYKQDWEMFKPPGEKRRKELHWAIREQLEYQPPPPRPQRTYVPNTYVVPTAKKRSALRWEIRHDLANGIVPARVTYT
ncbi:Hydrolethalus syndrome protein 1 [Bagarius yarrelli]|uniref:Hydrolethalus syndrome protein 1 n=1 Tax=Bagarius yarrelli TaxID=175774 RepID=A0A556V2E0_BAGYA|nr:Hydrolethalus syndrome protein 1 [Bagarius yarrelli]